MDPYITGAGIKSLREAAGLTQSELASKLFVSDKTISKWETGKGYPDLSLLPSLAAVLQVSLSELLSGHAVTNQNSSGNLLKANFYVCPVCGNLLYAMGEAAVSCHGVLLPPAEAEAPDANHMLSIEPVEDEYFISVSHEMTKSHYITFAAAVSCDRIQLVKFYPEGAAETRFKRNGVKAIYFYCNRDGLFRQPVALPKARG